MKRIISIALSLMLAAGLLAACGPADAPATGTAPATDGMPELVIGLFQPATGANGAGGRQESLGTI